MSAISDLSTHVYRCFYQDILCSAGARIYPMGGEAHVNIGTSVHIPTRNS